MLYVIKNGLGEYLQFEDDRDGPVRFTDEIAEARVYHTINSTYNIENHISDYAGGDTRRINIARAAFKGLTTQAVERKITEI